MNLFFFHLLHRFVVAFNFRNFVYVWLNTFCLKTVVMGLQIYKRLVDLLSLPAVDAQAAAVGALYNLAEVNMDCRLKLASERW